MCCFQRVTFITFRTLKLNSHVSKTGLNTGKNVIDLSMKFTSVTRKLFRILYRIRLTSPFLTFHELSVHDTHTIKAKVIICCPKEKSSVRLLSRYFPSHRCHQLLASDNTQTSSLSPSFDLCGHVSPDDAQFIAFLLLGATEVSVIQWQYRES